MFAPFIKRAVAQQMAGRQLLQKRHSGDWYYRQLPPIHEGWTRAGNYVMCWMWSWITYHFLTDYGHIIGHHNLPDPSSFTDEELGVNCDA